MMHIWKAGVHWMKSLTQFGMPMNGYRLDLVVKFLEVHNKVLEALISKTSKCKKIFYICLFFL